MCSHGRSQLEAHPEPPAQELARLRADIGLVEPPKPRWVAVRQAAAGGERLPFVIGIGDLGGQALVRVDLRTGQVTPLPLSTTRGSFTVDEASASVLTVTVDRRIHRLDARRVGQGQRARRAALEHRGRLLGAPSPKDAR